MIYVLAIRWGNINPALYTYNGCKLKEAEWSNTKEHNHFDYCLVNGLDQNSHNTEAKKKKIEIRTKILRA